VLGSIRFSTAINIPHFSGSFAREPRLTTTKVSNIQLRAFSF